MSKDVVETIENIIENAKDAVLAKEHPWEGELSENNMILSAQAHAVYGYIKSEYLSLLDEQSITNHEVELALDIYMADKALYKNANRSMRRAINYTLETRRLKLKL